MNRIELTGRAGIVYWFSGVGVNTSSRRSVCTGVPCLSLNDPPPSNELGAVVNSLISRAIFYLTSKKKSQYFV